MKRWITCYGINFVRRKDKVDVFPFVVSKNSEKKLFQECRKNCWTQQQFQQKTYLKVVACLKLCAKFFGTWKLFLSCLSIIFCGLRSPHKSGFHAPVQCDRIPNLTNNVKNVLERKTNITFESTVSVSTWAIIKAIEFVLRLEEASSMHEFNDVGNLTKFYAKLMI